MKILTIIFIWASVTLCKTTFYGTLRAIPINSMTDEMDDFTEKRLFLAIKNDKLVLSQTMAVFPCDKAGFLMRIQGSKTLNVMASGELMLASRSSGLLRVKHMRGLHERLLVFGNNQVFEICEDDSVYHNSDCNEPRKIRVVFEEIF